MEPTPNPLNGLLRSRAFWLAIVAAVQTVVAHYLAIPDDIWQAINALVMVIIAKMTIEDAARNLANRK